jgi:hypothetical protein
MNKTKLLIFALSLFMFSPSVVFGDAQEKITIRVDGVAVNDPRQVGDEERVPAVKAQGEVWSLEFSGEMAVFLSNYKKLPTGTHVTVVGVPIIKFNSLGNLVKMIKVTEVATSVAL